MPTYGTPQAGSNSLGAAFNLTSLVPGDKFTLFDGTETAASGLKSVAISRGYSPTGSNTMTFYVSGAPAGTTVDIQGANEDVDASYLTLSTITPVSGNGAYSDDGTAQYLRATLSAYTSGVMSVVKVSR